MKVQVNNLKMIRFIIVISCFLFLAGCSSGVDNTRDATTDVNYEQLQAEYDALQSAHIELQDKYAGLQERLATVEKEAKELQSFAYEMSIKASVIEASYNSTQAYYASLWDSYGDFTKELDIMNEALLDSQERQAHLDSILSNLNAHRYTGFSENITPGEYNTFYKVWDILSDNKTIMEVQNGS